MTYTTCPRCSAPARVSRGRGTCSRCRYVWVPRGIAAPVVLVCVGLLAAAVVALAFFADVPAR